MSFGRSVLLILNGGTFEEQFKRLLFIPLIEFPSHLSRYITDYKFIVRLHLLTVTKTFLPDRPYSLSFNGPVQLR